MRVICFQTPELIRDYLKGRSFSVLVAQNWEQIPELLRACVVPVDNSSQLSDNKADALLIGADVESLGDEYANSLRRIHSRLVIVAYTKRSAEHRAFLLDRGVDYVLPPPLDILVDLQELVAVLYAMALRLRRIPTTQARFGRLTIDFAARSVWVDKSPLKLSRTEFSMFEYLACRRGRIVSRNELVGETYRPHFEDSSDRSVDAHIKRIRQKLSAAGLEGSRVIETTYTEGYRFVL